MGPPAGIEARVERDQGELKGSIEKGLNIR